MYPTLLVVSAAACLISAAPVRYDQRQEGEFNVHAHLENFVIVLIPSSSGGLLDFVSKAAPGKLKHLKSHTKVVEDAAAPKITLEVAPGGEQEVIVVEPEVVASSAPVELPKSSRASSPVVLHEAPKLQEDARVKQLAAGVAPHVQSHPATRSSKLLAPNSLLSALSYGLSPASQ